MALDKQIVRAVSRTAMAVGLVALSAYPLDFAVWRVRVAMGGGMDTIVVNHYTVAELKGGKEDYYVDGTAPVDCSKSLFPEAGAGACWWVRRHSEVIARY